MDMGGQDGNFVVSGIDISAGTLPGEAPLLAAGDPLDGGAAAISLDMLQPVVAEAAARWSAAGLTPAQAATLVERPVRRGRLGRRVPGPGQPGHEPDPDRRRRGDAGMVMSVVSRSVVSGQWQDRAGQRTTDNGQLDGIDLLTVVMHEMGHLLGYEHRTTTTI